MGVSWVALAQTREPQSELAPPARTWREFWQSIASILSRTELSLVSPGSDALSSGCNGLFLYTVYAVRSLGMSEIAVGILTGVLLGTAIIANPVMGWIGDHWSHRLLMAIGVLGASASALIAWLAPTPIWFVPVFMLAGIANVAVWTISLQMIPISARSGSTLLYRLSQYHSSPR
jgi:MFS family permease